MTSNRINVGIIGLGRWAKVLARAAAPFVRVVSLLAGSPTPGIGLGPDYRHRNSFGSLCPKRA